uniref:Uncharacterized protein n=1 Tax=Pan troglodytes TaxID=9598 RepID=A0A2I3RML8_PANTR
VLLAHGTLHCCFGGKGHIWIDVRKTTFPSSFERLPLGSQEEGFPDFDTHGHLGTKALWYGNTNPFLCPLLPFHPSGRLVKSC